MKYMSYIQGEAVVHTSTLCRTQPKGSRELKNVAREFGREKHILTHLLNNLSIASRLNPSQKRQHCNNKNIQRCEVHVRYRR